MPGDPQEAQRRLARRIARLFRIERAGRLDRRPAAVARRLIERRGALIAALTAAGGASMGAETTTSSPLDRALAELALEIGEFRPAAERRRQQFADELERRRAGAPASGLRDGSGRLLGRG